MKKFLTVLLVIAVMFTFSFGSAMAATEYDVDDYYTALQAEKTAQLSYLANAKAQAVAGYSYNNLGFVKADFSDAEAEDAIKGYSKAALEAAADAVIEDLTKAMDEAINNVLNDPDDFPTTTAPNKAVVSNVTKDYLTAGQMKGALQLEVDVLNETQAPLTKKLVEEKLGAIDLTKYNSTDKTEEYDGQDVTPAEKVQALIDEATDKIAAAAKKDDDAVKRTEYEAAYAEFVSKNKVKTLDDEAFEAIGEGATIDKLVRYYVQIGLYNNDAFLSQYDAADDVVDCTELATNYLKAFWEENSTGSKGGKLFGVEIKNYEAVTRAEAVALYNEVKKAINDSAVPVKAYLKTVESTNLLSAFAAIIDTETSYIATLKNAMDAADKYADVVKAGEKLKARYDWGVKQYDEAKVDEAVKAAEELVYADLVDGFATDATSYIIAAANDIYGNTLGLNNLLFEAAKYEYNKFVEAVENAAKKMYEDGLTAKKVATKVSYGEDKTADADLVYLKGTYHSTQAKAWDSIAQDTIAKLKDAQSYDEITSIMNDAATEFGKLMKKDDKADVDKAIKAYQNSLKAYGQQKKAVLDTTVYDTATVDAAVKTGNALIADATSVDGVKAAYAEAQALVDNIKSKADLKAMKEAIEKQIAALPYTAKLTLADKEAVKAAYDAYVAYLDTPGTADDVIVTTLVAKYNRVNELEKEAINEEAKALKKKLDAVDSRSDADLPEYIALKAEALALVAKGTALADEIGAVNEDGYLGEDTLNTVDFCDEYDEIEAATSVKLYGEGEFYNQEIVYAQTLLVKAMKEGATTADMKAALEAFNKLTQRQQYELDEETGYYLQAAKVIQKKLAEVVETLKITASSKAGKGSITVTWKVTGDKSAADGYVVARSTKKNAGFKKMFTTKKLTYKNTKGLKKGTRYYYKVRAYKVVDGKTYYSDWSNKAYRVAK